MNKQYLWGGVVVVALVAWWAIGQEDGAIKDIVDNLNPSASDFMASPTPSASSSVKPVASVKATPKATKTPSGVPYTMLVQQYVGKRIQFDQYCQADPKNVTYNNRTTIMLDNRSGDARTVTVGGVAHYLAGYGYKIITLSSATLPKTLYLNCGSAVNVGQILLQ